MSAPAFTPFRVAPRSGAFKGLDIMCGGNRIASVSSGPAEKFAPLLAAAPDLVEMLKYLDAAYRSGNEIVIRQAFDEVRVAVAKVLGTA